MKRAISVVLLVVCTLFYPAMDQVCAQEWIQLNNGLTNTHVQCMTTVRSDLLVGTADGLFRSTDEGASWTNVLQAGMETDVEELATDGKSVIARIDSQFYLSTTGGNGNWLPIDVSTLPKDNAGAMVHQSYPACLAVLDSTVVVATAPQGIWIYPGVYTSTNLGATWTMRRWDHGDDMKYKAMILCVNNLYLVGWNTDLLSNNVSVERSTDTGISWTPTAPLPQRSEWYWFSAYCVKGMDFYVSIVAKRFDRRILRTTDRGESWTHVSSGFTGHMPANYYYPPPFAPIAARGTNLFACVADTLYASADNGYTWTYIDAGLATGKKAMIATENAVYVGTDDGVYRLPLSGSLSISVLNAEGWGNAGSGAVVELYDAEGSLVGTETTDASSAVTFSGVSSTASYSYRVAVPPAPGTPWTTNQYWGAKENIAVVPGMTATESFTRNAPYAPVIDAYNNKTSSSITNDTVALGIPIRIELTVKNPTYAGAIAQTATGRVILDRDLAPGQSSSYDFDSTGAPQSHEVGESRTVVFHFTPPDTGAYYYSESVIGTTALTDASGWGGPLFIVVPGDITAPASPMSLAATPAGWTNVNSFSVDWTNPADPSGIAAAWYKQGTAPASSTDGTRSTQKPLVVQATAEGGEMLHLWLENGLGLKDHARSGMVQLFLDVTPPTGGTIAINNGAGTTAAPVVALNGLGATDAGGSGLSQMRFSNDSTTWSTWEACAATKTGWDLTAGGGGAAEGTKTVYVQYRDAAGNISATVSDMITFSTMSVELWSAGIPEHFALHQNFPNPFNPTTVIRFDVPVASEVTLTVANLLGQEVAHLASGWMMPGSYGVRFDAGNFASGIYLYRFRAGDFVQTRKLVILK